MNLSAQMTGLVSIRERADQLFTQRQERRARRTDKLFSALMLVQWALAIGLAIFVSPHAWATKTHAGGGYLALAVAGGGALSAIALAFIWLRPGAGITRYAVAVCQMIWSSLLIHLCAGRIETHFHVF